MADSKPIDYQAKYMKYHKKILALGGTPLVAGATTLGGTPLVAGATTPSTDLVEFAAIAGGGAIAPPVGGGAVRENIDVVWKDDAKRTRFLKALKGMKESWMWRRVVGIHGGGFNFDPSVFAGQLPADEATKQNAAMLDKVGKFIATQGQHLHPTRQKPDGSLSFCSHGVVTFPVWHRYYVLEFEKILQLFDPSKDAVAAGRLPPLGLPYWAWNEPAGAIPTLPVAATVPTVTLDGVAVPNPLLAGPAQPKDAGMTGPSPGDTKRVRPDDPTLRMWENYDDSYYAQLATEPFYKVATTAGGAESLEDPHNLLHGSVGGDMGVVSTSSFDPIFWLHHCNVERLFCLWQGEDPDHGNIDKSGLKPQDKNWKLYPFANLANIGTQRAWDQGTDATVATIRDCYAPQDWQRHYVYVPNTARGHPALLTGFLALTAGGAVQPTKVVRVAVERLPNSGVLTIVDAAGAQVVAFPIFSGTFECVTCDARGESVFFGRARNATIDATKLSAKFRPVGAAADTRDVTAKITVEDD